MKYQFENMDKYKIYVVCSIAIIIAFGILIGYQAYVLDKIVNEYQDLRVKYVDLSVEANNLYIEVLKAEKSQPQSEFMQFTATAYDLSINSCEKPTTHDWYGISANGFDMRGLSREEAMSVAVDPSVIPLGSKLEIIFTREGYEHFSGVYTANDVGGAIKGAIVDVFLGDFNICDTELGMTDEVRKFGRQTVKIRRLS